MTADPGAPRAEPTLAPSPALGLTGLRAGARARVPIRTRASSLTRSAWRVEVACDQGAGTIVTVEVSPQETYYRGEGLFLGWSQEQLAAVQEALRPDAHESAPDLPQLG